MLFHLDGTLPPRMACFGASGTGVHIALDLRHQAAGGIEFVGYVDDVQDPRRRVERDQPVLNLDDLAPDVGVFVAVHDPQGRRQVHRRLIERGQPVLGALGSPHLAHPDAEVGAGSIVSSTARLGHSTRLGRGVLALGSLIAHDVDVGDFCTLAFGSLVLGHVRLGRGVLVGAGAVVQNGTVDRPVTVGDGAVIGAGAVVIRDVGPGETVLAPRSLTASQWRARLAKGQE